MRAAVISDVHGNEAALSAVLDDVAAWDPDELWCLGDLVGYGPRPNECAHAVRDRADLCLVGNHDLVALDAAGVDVAEFNPDAAAAALWTQERIDEETREYLSGLSPSATRGDVELHHASPRDPVWEYVLTAEAALGSFRASRAPLVLVGHSHVALALAFDGERLEGGQAPAGTELDLPGARPRRSLLNPGSVGQPRDGDPRAAWLALDLDAGRATFHRVDYDVERTRRELREAGLPRSLAERLGRGL